MPISVLQLKYSTTLLAPVSASQRAVSVLVQTIGRIRTEKRPRKGLGGIMLRIHIDINTAGFPIAKRTFKLLLFREQHSNLLELPLQTNIKMFTVRGLAYLAL